MILFYAKDQLSVPLWTPQKDSYLNIGKNCFAVLHKLRASSPNAFKMFIPNVLINGGIVTKHGKVLGTMKET